jgi:Lrp/AsnC family leucine-responsive transcriptional regulator
MENELLKGLDWQILELLQHDSRMTISEIASRLNRSRSSILEHIRTMQDAGILKSFSIEVDEEKLGFGIVAFVRLQASSSHHREIVSTIDQVPEIAECHVLTGSDLLMMRVVARDMSHLRELVDGFTKWGSTTTDVIFSTVKTRLQISPQLRRATGTTTGK